MYGSVNTYAYAKGNALSFQDPLGLYSWADFKQDVVDLTGGCSDKSFANDVISSFVNVQDATGDKAIKEGLALGLGGLAAKQYGGLTVGAAAAQAWTEYSSGYAVTGLGFRTFTSAITTAGATWAINAVLIKGSYDAGVLAGSILRTAVNRVASSGCGCNK